MSKSQSDVQQPKEANNISFEGSIKNSCSSGEKKALNQTLSNPEEELAVSSKLNANSSIENDSDKQENEISERFSLADIYSIAANSIFPKKILTINEKK